MASRMLNKTLLCATALSMLALSAPVAISQETAEEVRTLPTVTTTATKRTEDLQDVAVSVTSLDDEALDRIFAAGDDLQALSARVPSVVVESSFGRIFPRAYIRGLGNTDFDLNASQPVSFVYDDVVFENPLLKGFPVFDLQSVEVLRGPQGTLFGRNTPAGIIKFDSVKPTEEFDAYVRASYSDPSTTQLEGAVGGPVADGLSYRVSGLYQKREDWVDNAFTGENNATGGYDDLAWRAQILFNPDSTNLTALFNFHGRELEGGQQIFRANGLTPGSNALVPDFERDVIFADAQPYSVLDLSTRGLSSKIDYDFGAVTLTYVFGWESIESFSRGDVDGGGGAVFLPSGSQPGVIPFAAETADGIDDLEQITHEIRLANSDDARFNWTVGLYAFDEDVTISAYNYDTLAGGAPNGYAVQTQETEAYAVFASFNYDLTERLEIGGGIRYSDDSKDFVAERTVAIQPPAGPGTLLAPIFVNVGDEDVSWDLNATYALTENANAYARIARGFRAPSIQGRVLFGDVVTTADSETLTSYEAGVKADLLGNRVRTNIGVFYYEIEDQQLTAIGGAGNFNQLLNADKGEAYGFEAELEAIITDALTFTGGLSYNSTEIKDANLTTAPCGAPCTVLDPIDAGSGGALINGNSFPNAPEWIGNFVLDYRIPFAGGEFFANTDWAYKGETNFFLYDSIEFTQRGYWEGGVRAGYATGPWTFTAFGRNITDEIAVVGAIDFNNLTVFTNAPRTYGVEVRWQY